MGRPLYTHELHDPDFAWLISNFREMNPDYTSVEVALLPVIFIKAKAPQDVSEEADVDPREVLKREGFEVE